MELQNMLYTHPTYLSRDRTKRRSSAAPKMSAFRRIAAVLTAGWLVVFALFTVGFFLFPYGQLK